MGPWIWSDTAFGNVERRFGGGLSRLVLSDMKSFKANPPVLFMEHNAINRRRHRDLAFRPKPTTGPPYVRFRT